MTVTRVAMHLATLLRIKRLVPAGGDAYEGLSIQQMMRLLGFKKRRNWRWRR
jgi:hypothetical protein